MGVLVSTGAVGTARGGRCISAREDGPVWCGEGGGSMGRGQVHVGSWCLLDPGQSWPHAALGQ